jgi:DNA-binding NarL/FixJ family response regulator
VRKTFSTMRFLIADDSEFLRTRLVEFISQIEGTEIVGQAGSFEEVMEAVEDSNPDVVILDIRLPGKNGFLALERIKKRTNPPVVIMFTNYPYLQYRKRCMDLGADYFFYKAVEFDRLFNLIKDLKKAHDQT